MIDRDHVLSITRQAQLLNISRGTVYYLPQPKTSRSGARDPSDYEKAVA